MGVLGRSVPFPGVLAEPWTSGDPLREGQEPWTVVPSSERQETDEMTWSELQVWQSSAE